MRSLGRTPQNVDEREVTNAKVNEKKKKKTEIGRRGYVSSRGSRGVTVIRQLGGNARGTQALFSKKS